MCRLPTIPDDRVVDELRQSRRDLLEVRGKPRIADVERGEALMHLRRARIEPTVDVRAMRLDHTADPRIARGRTFAHQLREPFVETIRFAADRFPLGLAVLLRPT